MELAEIAQKIKNSNKKVTLLYAFNATGKTRLSMEFKNLVNEIRDDEVINAIKVSGYKFWNTLDK